MNTAAQAPPSFFVAGFGCTAFFAEAVFLTAFFAEADLLIAVFADAPFFIAFVFAVPVDFFPAVRLPLPDIPIAGLIIWSQADNLPSRGNHQYWRERYGAAESALGGTIELNGRRYAIVGIAPPGFAGMSGNARVWPLYTAVRGLSTLQSANSHQFDVVARLTPGTTAAAARTDVVNVGRVVNATYPDGGGATGSAWRWARSGAGCW